MILSFKQHPDVYGLFFICTGWITQHYGDLHDWLSLALLMISIVGGLLAIHLQILKIIEKRNKIKYYKDGYSNEKKEIL